MMSASGGGGKEYSFQMEDVAKKLTLWDTRTFRPILTHDELEPILASLGFVPLPLPVPAAADGEAKGRSPATVPWREYAFRCERSCRGGGVGGFVRRPRLPYPRIDGLHLLAYRAFFDALGFYLGPHLVPDLFHVRSMTIRAHDRLLDTAYRPMRDCNMDDEGIFVYREGTLDHITRMICRTSNNGDDNDEGSLNNGIGSRDSSKTSSSSICLIPLDDLFPRMDIVSLG